MSDDTLSTLSPPLAPATPRIFPRFLELWRLVCDAVRGAPLDLTSAPIGKALLVLAVPMILEMAMESVFALVDVFWVSHLGAGAVAAVGLTESMMMSESSGLVSLMRKSAAIASTVAISTIGDPANSSWNRAKASSRVSKVTFCTNCPSVSPAS